MSQAGVIKAGGGGTGFIETLTGNTGGSIGPDGSNNINIVGSGSITVTGNAGTNTLTISSSGGGSGITTLNGDSGSATGSTVTLYANQASKNSGSTVNFSNTGATSTFNVTDANGNTIIGQASGNSSLTGQYNSVLGFDSLPNLTSGNNNVCVGAFTMQSSTNCYYNTAVGTLNLNQLTNGQYNLAAGYQAGYNYTSTESNNILLNSPGVVGESNVLRIGAATGSGILDINKAYICGITGTNLSTTHLVTNVNDQLGSATLTGNTGITVGTTSSTIVLNVDTGGFDWTVFTGAAVKRLVSQSGSIANDDANLITMKLPLLVTVGSTFKIVGHGLGGWSVQPNSGQVIHLGALTTSTGASGSINSTNRYDCVELVCVVANTEYVCTDVVGNLTII